MSRRLPPFLRAKNPYIALDAATSALESNTAYSAAAAFGTAATMEGLGLVAVGSALVPGAVVLGTVAIGGALYKLIQLADARPEHRSILIEDEDFDHSNWRLFEERAAPSSSASTSTHQERGSAARFTPHASGPSILSTPIWELPKPSIFSTPIYPEQRPSIFITPTYDGPTRQEGFTPWTGPLPQNITVPVDLPDMTVLESSLMGEYRAVRGHHVHAKKAFEGHINYDPKKGFSISGELMDELNVRHADVTGAQRRLFGELARSGRPNTLKEHSRVAVEALVEGGATREQARFLVAKSLQDLKNKGVREPTNIPWNSKKDAK